MARAILGPFWPVLLLLLAGSCASPGATRVARSLELGVSGGDTDIDGTYGGSRADEDSVAVVATIEPLAWIEPPPMRVEFPSPGVEQLLDRDAQEDSQLALLIELLQAKFAKPEVPNLVPGVTTDGVDWPSVLISMASIIVTAAAALAGVKTGRIGLHRKALVGPLRGLWKDKE